MKKSIRFLMVPAILTAGLATGIASGEQRRVISKEEREAIRWERHKIAAAERQMRIEQARANRRGSQEVARAPKREPVERR